VTLKEGAGFELAGTGYRFLTGAFGYAVGWDRTTRRYWLDVTRFRLEQEGFVPIVPEQVPRKRGEFPKRFAGSIPVGAGVPTHLELVFAVTGREAAGPASWRLRDGITGFVLDPRGDVRVLGEDRIRVIFYPTALHPFRPWLEVREAGTGDGFAWVWPQIPGLPAENRGVRDLFAVEVPFYVGEAHDLRRLIGGLAQLEYEPGFLLVPQQLKPSSYEGWSIRELWEDYLSHDGVGGVFVDRKSGVVRRRVPWSRRLRQEWRKLWP